MQEEFGIEVSQRTMAIVTLCFCSFISLISINNPPALKIQIFGLDQGHSIEAVQV